MRLLAVVVPLSVFLGGVAELASSPPVPLAGGGPAAKVRTDAHGDPLPKGAVARLGSTRFRHRGFTFVGFSADGRELLFLSWQGYHWADLATGKFTRSIRASIPFMRGTNRPYATLAAKAPVLALGMDALEFHSITITDANSGEELACFNREDLYKGGSYTLRIPGHLTPDGKLLPLWGETFEERDLIRVFETKAKKPLYEFQSKKEHSFTAAALSRDGKTLAAVETSNDNPTDQWLRTWDLATGKPLRSLALATGAVTHLHLLPDNKGLLLAADDDKRVRLVDTTTGKEVRTFPDADLGEHYFDVSHDGTRLYTAGPGKVQEWDLTTGKPKRVFHSAIFAEDWPPRVVVLAPDGKRLVAVGAQCWTAWDLATGQELHTTSGHCGPVGSVAFAPDGRTLVTDGGDRTVRLWEVATGKVVRQLFVAGEDTPEARLTDELCYRRCAFSADGKVVAANGHGEGLYVWDAATGKLLERLGDERHWPLFAFGPQGRSLALHQQNGQLALGQAGSGKPLRSWQGPLHVYPSSWPPYLDALAFSPDGRLLALPGVVPGEAAIRIELWETATGKMRKALEWQDLASGGKQVGAVESVSDALERGDQPYWGRRIQGGPLGPHVSGSCAALVFTPDGRQLAAAAADTIYLFDVGSGKQVRSFGGPHLWGRALAFSPDGKWLACGRLDGSLRLWEVATGKLLRDVPGHETAVSAVAFAPDGLRLATASLDATVLLWDVEELLR
jgi:WD40 repeat protein